MRSHLLRAAAGTAAASGGGGSSGNHVTTNLIQHWDFGNSSSYSGSGTSVSDLSGNSNTGTLQNTSNISYSSDNGGHILLDPSASSNYPWIYRDTDTWKDIGTDDFTWEIWANFYFHDSNSTFAIYVNTPISSSPYTENSFIGIKASNYGGAGSLRTSNWLNATATNTAGSWTYHDSSAVYTRGAYSGWEHIVYSRIGTGSSNVKVYRNNSLIDTTTNKADYDIANTDTGYRRGVGRDTSGGLRGRLAILRFYIGTGLTASQVTQNYNEDKTRFGL
jgi:hypothetical protein